MGGTIYQKVLGLSFLKMLQFKMEFPEDWGTLKRGRTHIWLYKKMMMLQFMNQDSVFSKRELTEQIKQTFSIEQSALASFNIKAR